MKKTVRNVHKVVIALLIIGFTLINSPVGMLAQSRSLVIPKDTVILMEILDTLDSSANKAGDPVYFETRESVKVDGVVVIPYGTRGSGSLDEVHPAGYWGKGGYFKIKFGSLKTINNLSVPVEIGKAAQGAQQAAGVILPIVSLIIFWPLAFFGFSKGKEARIAGGTQLYVNTRNDVDLGMTAEEAMANFKASAGSNKQGEEASQTPPPPAQEGKPAKVNIPALTINDAQICETISETGEPVGANTVFSKDVRSLSIWVAYGKAETDMSLETRWFCGDELIKSKKLFISTASEKNYISGTIFFSEPLPEGNWQMDIYLNGQAIKSIAFKVQ